MILHYIFSFPSASGSVYLNYFYVQVCMYVCMYVPMYVQVYIYVCMYVYMYNTKHALFMPDT